MGFGGWGGSETFHYMLCNILGTLNQATKYIKYSKQIFALPNKTLSSLPPHFLAWHPRLNLNHVSLLSV